MKNILFINACPRPQSRTLALAQEVLKKVSGTVTEINLYQEPLHPLDWEQLKERDALIASHTMSSPMFDYAHQFATADDIVIAAPYWDLAFPSILRVYFEQITVLGVTFTYSPEGIPVGLCRAGRILYVTTAGGPIGPYNLGYDYVKALATLYYGIPQVLCFAAEKLDIVGADVPSIMEQAIANIKNSPI